MVSNIGGASAVPAAYAATPKTSDRQAPAASAPAPAPAAGDAPAAPTRSAESASAARLGEQFNAQADASRVQRAVDEMPAETTQAQGESAPSGAAPAQAPAKGGGAASSATTDTDYIAEADTNSDKTVSDQERAAYEARLREQNEKQAAVRAAYGQDQTGATPALDVTA